eukprot:CAMPEP_0176300666 /NCGR_PEP_ID=MMETSP0121_2-20121125/60443_1 /TAXON_ID=160619 /ORGANISM="Kryptoperidinium foliaceum, Strain CCMP 1326" /LENGTH=273 /DNA_ID=CAMNT_0017642069 /DNA_START=23 /DNA_END=844 /DNA_ORIENTATION=-
MPRSVGPVLASLSDCAMPTTETIREALLVFNGEHPVSLEEAEYVRHLALALGGSRQKVSAKQMRMAIAAWYLHIERRATSNGRLARHAVSGTADRVCIYNPLQRFCRGQWDPITLSFMGMFFVAWVVVPTMAIWIGVSTNTADYPCDSPFFSHAVEITGCLTLGQALVVFLVTGAWECTALSKCRLCSCISLGFVSMALVLVWLMGFWMLMTTTPSRCGFLIWEFGNLIWIVAPVLCLVFTCCCIPCIYLHEYLQNKRIDQRLMLQGGGGDEE